MARLPAFAIALLALPGVEMAQEVVASRTTPQDSVERELTAVLRFEVLWGSVPPGFSLPEDGTASLAVYAEASPRSAIAAAN